MKTNARHGFTLIELLASASIIGLLAGLLLPAVQAARESARRTRCANNLKQIGIALHSYHGTSDCFPADFMTYRTATGAGPPKSRTQWLSSLSRILPYVEQGGLFNSINFETELYPPASGLVPDPINATAYNTSVTTFLCPSDSQAMANRNNYRGNVGVGPAVATSAESYDSGNGFFTFPGFTTAASFADGLSHTACFSERLCGTGSPESAAAERDLGGVGPPGDCLYRDADYALACCRVASRLSFPSYTRAGWTWMFAGRKNTTYCHAQEPNGSIPDGASASYSDGWGITTARSWHRGGVNVLMGDAGTRFVRETINRNTWRGLGTRSGGEIIE